MSIILINERYIPLLNKLLFSKDYTGELQLRDMLKVHLKKLSSEDRYLRFFSSLSDYAIESYVDKLDFSKDSIFVKFNKNFDGVIGCLHLAKVANVNEYEIGVSVDEDTRGTGLGYELFARAVSMADDWGVKRIYINCLAKNQAMQKIARRFKIETKSVDYETKEGEILFDEHPNVFGYNLSNTMNKIALYDMAMQKQIHKVSTLWSSFLTIGQTANSQKDC